MKARVILKSLEDLWAQDFAEVLADGHLEAQEPPRSPPISPETVSYRHWGINE